MISTINPFNETLIQTYKTHKVADLYQIISSAHAAQQAWKQTALPVREQHFIQLAAILRQEKELLAKQISLEMGKPIQQSFAEIEKCAWIAEYFAKEAQLSLKGYTRVGDSKVSDVLYEPLGLVLGIMPWNFPFWQVFRFAIPALIAGNGIIIKHAPITTGCGQLIVELFEKAGFPRFLCAQVVIDESDCSELIMHPLIRAVSLTGSERAGRAVASLAGMHLKKTVLELGGSDAYLVLEDADLDMASEVIVASRMNNAGQVCIAAKRIIAQASIIDALAELIREKLSHFKMADPVQAETTLGPMARADLRHQVNEQVQQSIALGAKCLLGGEIPLGPGYFYPATLLTDVKAGQAAFDEELFGPVIALITAQDVQQAVLLANQSRYGLGAAIFTQDLAKAQRIASLLDVGTVSINGMVVSDPALPFGGVKNSGYGRELGQEGMLEFCNIKVVSRYV